MTHILKFFLEHAIDNKHKEERMEAGRAHWRQLH